MPDQRYGTKPLVTVNGSRLATPFDDRVVTVTVDQDLTSPTACEITVADPDRSFLATTGVALGQSLKIEASPVAGDEAEPIFDGAVHSIDVVFDEAAGQSVVVVGYDGSYPLTQRCFSRSWTEVTVSDVVGELCRPLSITVGADDLAAVVHPHLGLFDESPWEFITRHAAHSSCVVRFRDGHLEVTKPDPASGGPAPGDHGARQPTQLVPGHNVTHLRVHATTARQVEQIEVRGWDVKRKDTLVGMADATTPTAESTSRPASVGAELGGGRVVEPRPSLGVQAACDHHARAIAASLASQHITAEGDAIGQPALAAGVVVSLGAMESMSGKYLLTQCRHRFDDRGYVTEFRCSGLLDRSLLGLLAERPRRRLDGLYPAIVTGTADPDELGRVKVKFPWLSDDYESYWARVCHPGAGADRGLQLLPEVDDEVAVAFVDGEPSFPLVVGGLYNGVDKPAFPDAVDGSSGKVQIRGLKTRAGHVVELVDTEGSESVKLTTADGKQQVVLDQAGRSVSLTSGGDLTISASGALTLKADGDVTVKGTKINLN